MDFIGLFDKKIFKKEIDLNEECQKLALCSATFMLTFSVSFYVLPIEVVV